MSEFDSQTGPDEHWGPYSCFLICPLPLWRESSAWPALPGRVSRNLKRSIWEYRKEVEGRVQLHRTPFPWLLNYAQKISIASSLLKILEKLQSSAQNTVKWPIQCIAWIVLPLEIPLVTICTVQWSLYVPHSGHYIYRTLVTICTAQWSLYVPHCGHYMYRTVVTVCTAHW